MKILVIEDDKKIAAFLGKGFKAAGFGVELAYDGDSGLELALAVAYDAMVVDIMLPGKDGLSLVRELRRLKKDVPVIFLSAKRGVDDRIIALDRGGDDYLCKPFSFAELLARIKALLRRTSPRKKVTRLRSGDLVLDLLTRRVQRGGKTIELQAKEFTLLQELMNCPGQPLSKSAILEKVWDYHFDPQTNVVDVLVSRLRARIDRGFGKKRIRTVRGLGYVFE